MSFRPLHDRVLVRRVEENEKTPGGIIIPDTAKEKPQEGKVVAVGPGSRGDDGKITPLSVQAGDRSLLVNRELLARGAARILRIEPNTARAAEFDAVAAAARASGAGLWGACGK